MICSPPFAQLHEQSASVECVAESRAWFALAGMKMRKYGKTGFLLLACCVVGIASGPTRAAATTVYKCFDKSLGVLYTDEPCKGEQMNIRAGEADPIAVAELQREREALSRSAAQRITDNRRAALEREIAAQRAYAPVDVVPNSNADAYYPAGYGFIPYSAAKHSHPRALKRFERERFVPNPSRGLLRK